MKLDRIKRAASLILCALMLSSDMALCIQAAAEEITDIAAGTAEATVSAIGKTAEFSGSYPVTIAPAPLTAANLEGFTEAQLQAEDIPAGALFYITDEAESAVNGSVWYKLDATPDTQMPAKLAANPWVLFGYATGETTSALYVHDGGKNYVFNDRGEIVTSIEMEQKTAADPYNDVTLYGASTLFGQVAYKWQISRPEDGGVWVDLYGENSSVLTVRESMLTVGETVLLRSVSTVDGKTALSDPVAVTLKEAVAPIVPTEILPGFVMMSAAPEPEEDNYSIVINYVFKNGGEAAPAWTVSLKKGHPQYHLNVMSPRVVGYKPDQDRITGLVENINQNYTYTVTYEPDEVNYVVNHWFQNTDNDNYSYNPQYPSETKVGLTGTAVPTTLAIEGAEIPGFYSLLYDTTLTLAADGTTVVNIYYDRRYVKVDLKLAGGYNAEPIYARYGTVIQKANIEPKRTGYTFAGWSPALPDTVPAVKSEHTAQWTPSATTYTVAFWYENANDTNYTFVGSAKRTATTGQAVSGSINDYNSASTTEIPGKDTTNFHDLAKADQNVTVKADGTTVVNVYIKRATYTLTYKEFVCPHSAGHHTTDCCSLVLHPRHNETVGQCCSIAPHTHSTSCCDESPHRHNKSCASNVGVEAGTYQDWRIDNTYKGSLYNGAEHSVDGQNFVYFDGKWWNIGGKADWNDPRCEYGNCPGLHTHGSCNTARCGNQTVHTHGSGCNTSACPYNGTHDHNSTGWQSGSCNSANCSHAGKAYAGCSCWKNNAIRCDESNWVVSDNRAATATFKYGADVSGFHAARKSYRWVPGLNTGFSSGNMADHAGGGGAVGTFSSMKGNDVIFYRSGDGSTTFYFTFWLEVAEGTGDRYYNGKWYERRTTFKPRMGAVGYIGDYQAGRPVGFDDDKAWVTNSEGGENSNVELVSPDGYFGADRGYVYYNFYYKRQVYKLQYHSNTPDGKIATVDMKFEQPLTKAFNVTAASLGFANDNSGLEFKGWYLDAACNVPAEFDGSVRMPNAGKTGNIGLALYAKWDYKQETVTCYDFNGNLYYQATATHGTTVSNPPAAPEREGMEFIGWFYQDDETRKEVAYDFSIPLYKSLQLYPKYVSTEMTKVFVYYKVRSTGQKVAQDTETSGLIGTTKTFNAKAGDELFSGFTEGFFPEVQSHNVEFVDTTAVEYTFYYTEKEAVSYKIVHHVKNDDGSEQIREDTGTSKSAFVIVYRDTDVLKDYVADAVSKKLILSSDESLNVVHFYYEKPSVDDPSVTVSVQIVHQTENIANSNYTEVASYPTSYIELKNGETRVISEGIMYIPGFTFSVSESERLSSPAGSAFVYDMGANTFGAELTYLGLELVLCYKRNEYPYEFRFVDQSGNRLLTSVEGTAKYQASVSYTAPTIPGYKLYSDGTQSINIEIEEGSTASRNVVTFSYMEDTVKIEYQAQTGGTVSPESEEIYSKSGTATGSYASVASKYYDFDGWYDSAGNRVGNEYRFIPQKDGDSYKAAKYTAGFKEKPVTIYYKIVGVGGSLTSGSEVVDVLTGETKGSTAVADTGYAFKGWYRDAACEDLISDLSTTIKPSKPGEAWSDGTTYYAKFEEQQVEIIYKATVGGSVTSPSETVKGVSGTVRGSVAQAKPGYVFIGWYRDDAFVTTDPAIHPEKESATYEARFTELLSTITYVVKGPVYGCGTVTPSAETLNQINALADGSTAEAVSNLYRFVGWFDNESCTGTPITENATFIPTKNEGEAWPESVTYYAKFEYNLTSLTVTKSGAETVDENQTFLFEITDSDGLAVRFTIHGNGSVVISGLTVGKTYTVTEITEWSWRYSNDSSSKDITLEASGNTLTFVNTRKESKWLDGDSWSQHISNDGEGR